MAVVTNILQWKLARSWGPAKICWACNAGLGPAYTFALFYEGLGDQVRSSRVCMGCEGKVVHWALGLAAGYEHRRRFEYASDELFPQRSKKR